MSCFLAQNRLKNRIFAQKNQKFQFLMLQRIKNDKKTSVINQKQRFQSSMGCFNSIGICCSMDLDTKLPKDFKFSIKNRKLSISDPHIGQNMTKKPLNDQQLIREVRVSRI